jgi:hypothetical protein
MYLEKPKCLIIWNGGSIRYKNKDDRQFNEELFVQDIQLWVYLIGNQAWINFRATS